jgi:multimeric flavodoxin WrbA
VHFQEVLAEFVGSDCKNRKIGWATNNGRWESILRLLRESDSVIFATNVNFGNFLAS